MSKRNKFVPPGKVLKVSDVKLLVANDPEFPPSNRASTLSSLNRLPVWASAKSRCVPALKPHTMTFNERVVNDLFADLAPHHVGRTRKRIENARGDCRFVLERYGLGRKRLRVKLSPAVQALNQKLPKFHRIAISKLFAFLSVHEIDPGCMSDGVAQQFREWLHLHSFKNGDRLWRRALKAWNRACQIPGWPQIDLAVPHRRKSWGTRWEGFPPQLELATDAFFARGETANGLFSEGSAAPPLKPITVVNQKECVRWAASALVRSGLAPDEVRDLRDVCSPDRYRRALDQLAHQKGCANSSIGLVAAVLAKIAKYSGVLTPDEIEEVKGAHMSVQRAVKYHNQDREDRDQELLNQLDDPKVLDALLTLARRTVRRVLASGKKTYREAIAVQMALIVELWLCAPIRLGNMRHLRLDEHFFRIMLDDIEYVVLRVAPTHIKNHNRAEHLLDQDTEGLLYLYIEQFLPIITAHNPSPWLFPGRGGKPKAPQVFRSQTSKFVREGTGLDFHPHAIRKIDTKIYLDQDPGGIEVVRRTLGDTTETTRGVYAQHVQRASQRKYLAALENRRLAAFVPLGRCKTKGKR